MEETMTFRQQEKGLHPSDVQFMKSPSLAFYLWFVFSVSGCHAPATGGTADTADTDGTEYSNGDSESGSTDDVLVSLIGRTFVAREIIRDGTAEPLLTGTLFEVRFGEDGVFYAFGGCNSIQYPIAMNGNTLVVETIDMYMVSCGEYLDAQVEMLIAFLESDPVVTTDGDTLVLAGFFEANDVQIEFIDAATVSPNWLLEGTRWEVVQCLVYDIITSDGWTTTATVAFQENGVMSFDTGCNSGTGIFQVDGDQVLFSDLTYTEDACLTLQDDVREEVMLQILTCDGLVDWEVTWSEGERLSLRAMEDAFWVAPISD